MEKSRGCVLGKNAEISRGVMRMKRLLSTLTIIAVCALSMVQMPVFGMLPQLVRAKAALNQFKQPVYRQRFAKPSVTNLKNKRYYNQKNFINDSTKRLNAPSLVQIKKFQQPFQQKRTYHSSPKINSIDLPLAKKSRVNAQKNNRSWLGYLALVLGLSWLLSDSAGADEDDAEKDIQKEESIRWSREDISRILQEIEDDPSTAVKYTPLAVKQLVELCEMRRGRYLLKKLLEEDSTAARQFMPLAEKQFYKLCETTGGKFLLQDLLNNDPGAADLFTSLVAKRFDKLMEFRGFDLIEILLEKNDKAAAELIPLVAEYFDELRIKYIGSPAVQFLETLFNHYPDMCVQFIPLVEKNIGSFKSTHDTVKLFKIIIDTYPQASGLFTSAAVKEFDFDWDNNFRVWFIDEKFIEILIEKDYEAAAEFIPLAVKHFDVLCADGLSILKLLVETYPQEAAAEFIPLAVKHFDVLCADRLSILKLLVEKCPQAGAQFAACKEIPLELFTKIASKVPCCEELKSHFHEGDMDIENAIKALSYNGTCPCDQGTCLRGNESQSLIHIKSNMNKVVESSTTKKALKNPNISRMISDVLAKEQDLHNNYYTFVHGQRCNGSDIFESVNF